jgi:hypothetical protein
MYVHRFTILGLLFQSMLMHYVFEIFFSSCRSPPSKEDKVIMIMNSLGPHHVTPSDRVEELEPTKHKSWGNSSASCQV